MRDKNASREMERQQVRFWPADRDESCLSCGAEVAARDTAADAGAPNWARGPSTWSSDDEDHGEEEKDGRGGRGGRGGRDGSPKLSLLKAHIAAQREVHEAGEAASSWVVQRYIDRPLLLSGGDRKFDMRCWVLVDSAFNVHLYRHGVLRTSAVAYDASDLSNRHAHLTNHCIAATHTDYGKFEPTNEMWYASGTRLGRDTSHAQPHTAFPTSAFICYCYIFWLASQSCALPRTISHFHVLPFSL